MSWTPITDAEMAMACATVLWIKTARSAGYGGPDWLPSDADICKSALLERLRSGKEPLDEPPPLGMSCPWYALIEDRGPHYVFDVWRGGGGHLFDEDTICALQTPYKIVEQQGEQDFIVRDGGHNTAYRFHLWYAAEWIHPSHQLGKGGWFMQNLAPKTAQAPKP